MVFCTQHKNLHCGMFYILMLLFTGSENLSHEDSPEDKPLLLARDQSSPEKDAWDIQSNSVESSFTDSSVTSGTWNTYVLFVH